MSDKLDNATKDCKISFRVENDLKTVIDKLCETENTNKSQGAYDAVALYADLWPVLHLMKSLKLNPDFKADYDEVRRKILEAVEKSIGS